MIIDYNGRDGIVHSLKKNAIGAEIGVARGDFASRLLNVAKPRSLLLIDAWEPYEVPGTPWCSDRKIHDDNYKKVTDRFRFRNEVQVIRARSLDAIRSLPDRSLDWVHIDACHKFESVLNELHALWPKMNDDSVIVGHDYIDHIGYGVIKAVEEFCFYTEWKLRKIFFERDRTLHPSFMLSRETCPR